MIIFIITFNYHVLKTLRSCFSLLFWMFGCCLANAQALPSNEMRAHFINVGQANATLLEFSCGAVLIDAGDQDAASGLALVNYLHRFFVRRTDLNKTLALVIITHDHKDHNAALQKVAAQFVIKNYIENGVPIGSGSKIQNAMDTYVAAHGIAYANFSYDQAVALPGHPGLHSAIIDSLNCSGTDPDIRILSGRFAALPQGWTQKESDKNGNLYSLVIKVTFGQSSFLFTGDLELKAMQKVLDLYKGSGLLDADVWEVSHHGSYNGTTSAWLREVTPKYAIIPCGQWNSEINTVAGSFNTYNYGHPRIVTLDTLAMFIPGSRPVLDSIVAFSGIRDQHRNYKVTKNIYCSAWDGIIVLSAFQDGTYKFITP